MNLIFNIDAITPPLTGIGYYALRLAQGLKQDGRIQNIKYFSAYRWIDDPERALIVNQPMAQIRRRIPYKNAALQLYNFGRNQLFQWATRGLQDYILHTPNYVLIPFSGPSITTIHDLSHIHYPEYHPKERVAFLEKYMPRTFSQAAAIITVSLFVKEELVEILGLPEEKISVVPLGVDAAFHPRDESALGANLADYGLAYRNYLLVVATLEPRKNLQRLVDAYSRLNPSLLNRYPLVLVGSRGWLNERLEQRLGPLERKGLVRRLGYVPQKDLPLIYSGARAFALPSLYEGFGLPVLEAMASGVPTLTSSHSSLSEVAGDSALLVNPQSVEDITLGLQRLLEDTAWREAAIQDGIQQAGKFTWLRCVNETIDVYRRVLDA